MKKITTIFFLFLITTILTINAQPTFDLTHANKQLDIISKRANAKQIDLQTLKHYSDTLETLQAQAKQCSKNARDQLNTLKNLLKKNGIDWQHANSTAAYKYLSEKQKYHSHNAANCELFNFQSNELLTSIGYKIQIASTEKLFQRNDPIWVVFNNTFYSKLKKAPLYKSHAINSILFTILLMVLGSIVWYFLKSSSTIKQSHTGKRSILFIIIIAILFIVTPLWLGYQNLALFISKNMLLTIVLTLITFNGYLLIDIIFRELESKETTIGRKIHDYMGLKMNKKITELFILRLTMTTVFFIIVAILYFEIWSGDAVFVDRIQDAFTNGFTFFDTEVFPLRIIVAILTFCVTSLLFKVIATLAAKAKRFKGERDSQAAVASILNYFGFASALIIAMLVGGMNLTGLAIVAGALSVGIGFGLQNIVNNFISGVILLLHKPIRPGDRVVVDGTEGFVKKIRIFSTQINTLSKEDVIIPNSHLLSNPVTNYMFRDSMWRVICKVGVRYGSDIVLVRSVLLKVAADHPDAILTEPNKPSVLFRTFGDSSLEFELWCIIKDVNRKFHVQSELNIAIDKAFREHNIVIAFPQRDVHIHNPNEI